MGSRTWKPGRRSVEAVLKTCTQAIATLPLKDQFRVISGIRTFVQTPSENSVPDDDRGPVLEG